MSEEAEEKKEVLSTQKILNVNGRKIILVGTAHVSQASIDEVNSTIEKFHPSAVAIELDQGRFDSLTQKDAWQKMDIVKVLKKKQGFLLMANVILASYQKRMGQKQKVAPGAEMMAAIEKSKELGIPTTMVDRPIAVTLRRAWAKNSFWGKMKLLGAMLSSVFQKEEVDPAEIEKLKVQSEMDSMMSELSKYLPKVKEVLIDERDRYLASHILETEGDVVLAVLGAGHLPGVQKWIEEISAGQKSGDCTEISEVPKKSVASKILPWLIPLLIVALIAISFVYGGAEMGKKAVGSWVLWNAVLAGIGALIGGAHPVTILVSLVSAPFTSLCPFIGVGVVAGIVQAVVCKPRVGDIEKMTDDAGSFKGFYKNRILRVLMVFIFSSIGSTIGTFVSGAGMFAGVTKFFDQIIETVKGWFGAGGEKAVETVANATTAAVSGDVSTVASASGDLANQAGSVVAQAKEVLESAGL